MTLAVRSATFLHRLRGKSSSEEIDQARLHAIGHLALA